MTVLHVATNGSDRADGSPEHPLRTIGHAAAIARPGDTVTVHAGEYREWVKPRRGGISDRRRITYQAAEGEHVVIKGSEVVTGWEPGEGTVWKAVVANDLFGAFNPFAEEIEGDWIVYAEKTSPEIADELGVSGTVVRVARHRALERLRDCVGLRGAGKP